MEGGYFRVKQILVKNRKVAMIIPWGDFMWVLPWVNHGHNFESWEHFMHVKWSQCNKHTIRQRNRGEGECLANFYIALHKHNYCAPLCFLHPCKSITIWTGYLKVIITEREPGPVGLPQYLFNSLSLCSVFFCSKETQVIVGTTD